MKKDKFIRERKQSLITILNFVAKHAVPDQMPPRRDDT